jgi:hypothetical protein
LKTCSFAAKLAFVAHRRAKRIGARMQVPRANRKFEIVARAPLCHEVSSLVVLEVVLLMDGLR